MSKSRINPGLPTEPPEGQVNMLRTIVAELPGIVFVVDREGTILLEEGRGTGMLGRPSELVIGRSVFEVFRDAPEVCACVRRALSGEEFMATLELGSGIVEVRYAPVRSGGPESPVVGVIGVSHDVTQTRRMQQDLLASQMMYKTVIDTTDTGYVTVDMAGRVMDANEEYVRLTGHSTLEEIRGRGVIEWTAPHDIERNRIEVQKCVKLGSVRNLCIDYIDRLGKITPIEINATFIPMGKSGRILCLCRDVSQRRRAEQILKQSELMNRAVLDSMQAAIAVLDPEGRILQVNAGWERLRTENGLAELGATGPGDDYFAAWRKAASRGCEDSQRCLSHLESLGGGASKRVEFEYRPPSSGRARRYRLRAVPLSKPPGGLVVAHIEIPDSESAPPGPSSGR